MDLFLRTDRLTIQSKFRWFPSLNTKFQLLDEGGTLLGELIFHPAWMAPVLWLFGLLFELGLIGGGLALIASGEGSQKLVGVGIAILGLFFFLGIQFRGFLSSRASSQVEVIRTDGQQILQATKGWAIFRPTFTIQDQDQNILGSSRQSFFWGDLKYTIWDADGKEWGTIERRILGFQYRVYKNGNQVARFRRKLVDTRKLLTGIRSYRLDFQEKQLTAKERALIVGSLAYADVLVRQKKLRQKKGGEEESQAQSGKKS